MERVEVLTKLVWGGDFFAKYKKKGWKQYLAIFFYNKIEDSVVNKKIDGVGFFFLFF